MGVSSPAEGLPRGAAAGPQLVKRALDKLRCV